MTTPKDKLEQYLKQLEGIRGDDDPTLLAAAYMMTVNDLIAALVAKNRSILGSLKGEDQHA